MTLTTRNGITEVKTPVLRFLQRAKPGAPREVIRVGATKAAGSVTGLNDPYVRRADLAWAAQ